MMPERRDRFCIRPGFMSDHREVLVKVNAWVDEGIGILSRAVRNRRADYLGELPGRHWRA